MPSPALYSVTVAEDLETLAGFSTCCLPQVAEPPRPRLIALRARVDRALPLLATVSALDVLAGNDNADGSDEPGSACGSNPGDSADDTRLVRFVVARFAALRSAFSISRCAPSRRRSLSSACYSSPLIMSVMASCVVQPASESASDTAAIKRYNLALQTSSCA